MTSILNKYSKSLNNRIKKTTINHKDRAYLHKMSKEELEKHYSKYFSEQGNIECCLRINNEFEQIENADLERYEKWLMESD